MRVRATLKLRNDYMIVAREKAGLSQGALAEKARCSIADIIKLERFRYDVPLIEDKTLRIAVILGIQPDLISPPGLVDAALTTTFIAIRDVPESSLLAHSDEQFLLPAPDEAATQEEFLGKTKELLDKAELTENERKAVEFRSGLDEKGGRTFKEIGEIIGISTARAAEIYHRAIRKLRKCGEPLAREMDKDIIPLPPHAKISPSMPDPASLSE